MERYEKIVLEAEKGITFETSKGTSGELIIRALNSPINHENFENSEKTEPHENLEPLGNSENYATPPIPEGYKHICGEWNNGFVIERCSDGSQFVWIPVGSLDSNGTLDGVLFNEKFGRRNYMCDLFSEGNFHETFTDEFALQLESIKKYGGFYISRYNISKNKKTGKPQSVKGEDPWTNINFYVAKEIAAILETSDTITSHLTFGAEYDSVLEWFIKSKAKNHREIAECSTKWGNYWNAENSPKKLVETGSREEWRVNNIYDFAGNVTEWTQEQNDSSNITVRGGEYCERGRMKPVAFRDCCNPNASFRGTGFRAALYIK